MKGGYGPHPKYAAALLLLALATVATTARPALQMISLFAWDAEKKLGIEGAGVHVQADPSQAELMRRKFESQGLDMKDSKRRAVLDQFGGEEYLDATLGVVGCSVAGRSLSAPLDIGVGGGGGGNGNSRVALKETLEEQATRFDVLHVEQEYGRDVEGQWPGRSEDDKDKGNGQGGAL